MSKFKLVSNEGGDWYILYRDGEKIASQHSFYANELMELLGVDFEAEEISDDLMEQIC